MPSTSKSRPENQAPPEIYYDESEADKYTSNTRVMKVQAELTSRVIEILNLPEDKSAYLLDIGSGSGLSMDVAAEEGHVMVGMDISSAMLDVAIEREVEGDVALGDMGQGLPFRAGTFDGVMSVSALQWLCNADKRSHHPPKRLLRFFTTLYSCMRKGTRAVFQLYPQDPKQMELISKQAVRAGFMNVAVIVDFPNSTKAKKIFLSMTCGDVDPNRPVPAALGEASTKREQATFMRAKTSAMRKNGKGIKNSREWIIEKKERNKRQNKEVRDTTKYTGRKRKTRFN